MALFRKIFSLELTHSYFNNGLASGVKMRPDHETETFIRNNRMIFRSENGGIFVAAQVKEVSNSSEENEYRLARDIEKNSVMRFLLEIKNPALLAISRLPGNLISETLMLFSNRNGSVFDGKKYLHPEEDISTNINLRLQKNRVFRTSENTGEESARASLQSPDGHPRKDITAASGTEGTVHFQFDLGSLPSGNYEYWYEKKLKDRFYWNGFQRSAGLWGIVEVETSPQIPESHRLFSEEGILQNKNFHILLKNRETIWRYHIVSRSNVNLENCSVGSDEYLFSPKDETETATGETSRIFESDHPVPLLEKGIKGIRLKLEEDESERLLIDNLPGADIKSIEADRTDMNRFYSDIYVYI